MCLTHRALALRDRNRRKNYKRRARRTGNYRLADIADRDGYRCHLCRRKVDMRLSGNHRMGPTIDHLVPLSQGGGDEAINVRLAHRSCNVNRNIGGEVQLLLVA